MVWYSESGSDRPGGGLWMVVWCRECGGGAASGRWWRAEGAPTCRDERATHLSSKDEWTGYRRPYARQRRESDEGEEEGFLYCLMYYFDEARREAEDGLDRRGRRSRRYCEEEEEESAGKKKEDEEDEEMLNPLVYRESLTGRTMRGGMMRRAYTPDRDNISSRSSSAASSLRSRSHSQPPEINHNNLARRHRKKK